LSRAHSLSNKRKQTRAPHAASSPALASPSLLLLGCLRDWRPPFRCARSRRRVEASEKLGAVYSARRHVFEPASSSWRPDKTTAEPSRAEPSRACATFASDAEHVVRGNCAAPTQTRRRRSSSRERCECADIAAAAA
jgi:hypothetical protein